MSRGTVSALRQEYPGKVDSGLVDLAALGALKSAGPEAPAVQKYYEADPKTFALRENQLAG